MPDDPIKRWLRWADDTAGAPPQAGGDLAGRVRHLAARRRRRAIAGSAAALLAAGLVGAVIWVGLTTTGRTPRGPGAVVRQELDAEEIARLRTEMARLKAEADWRTKVAAAMVAQERTAKRLATLRKAAPRLDPAEEIRQETDKAALVIVRQADRLYREHHLRDRAIQRYRDAIQLFPQSPWADVARQRLAALNSSASIFTGGLS
jgi:hypothetical protein